MKQKKRLKPFHIYAVTGGIVLWVLKEVRKSDGYRSKYGLRVLILHKDGTVGWYCHLKRTHLKKGQIVKQGSLIGLMGNTGMPKQTHITQYTQMIIKKHDPTLYTWLTDFKSDKYGIILCKKMKLNLIKFKRLELFLDKHLHLMLSPDEKHLHGKYSINPIEWILTGYPATNTPQTEGGGYKAINPKYWDPHHYGVDFTGRIELLISGWENLTEYFFSTYYASIDKEVV